MEGYCSAGQSPQWAVVPVGEEEDMFVLVGYAYVLGLFSFRISVT
jgi:hypothetical protein